MNGYQLSDQQRQIYRRYAGLALPRHTSYPIVPVWTSAYGAAELREDLRLSAQEKRPLSLYIHIPFCERLCYYCACTKEIISPSKRQQHDPSGDLLAGLALEVPRFAALTGRGTVQQVHLGGGSPTFLRPPQLRSLWQILQDHFALANDAEIAIEIDPRITTLEHLQTLRELGFNRISLGIQDFNPEVQKAVNRIQPFEQVQQVVDWCRALGFGSLNFDLIYGLPFQTMATMADTLEQTLALRPDRIAFYRLAVIPEIFRWQNVFRPLDLPAGELSLDLNLLAINRFLEAGYEFIGLDHFARPEEALAQAVHEGSLRRTFQGMTTGKPLDILGFGPSAITHLDNAFAQNQKESVSWQEAIATDLATERGLRLNDDDRLRRELMQQLYGHGTIDKPSLENTFAISFDSYFANELQRLESLVDEGVVEVSANAIRLSEPVGRLLVRVVAAVFDRYLPPRAFCEGLPAEKASRVG